MAVSGQRQDMHGPLGRRQADLNRHLYCLNRLGLPSVPYLSSNPAAQPAVIPHRFTSQKTNKMKKLTFFSVVSTLVIAGCTTDSSMPGSDMAHSQVCKATSEQEISALFDRWNRSLQTGDPHQVVANYAERSVLLPTVSNKPRVTAAEKEDYFHHFLENRPVGKIDWRMIEIDCNTAVDAGLYTFTFGKTGSQVKARYTYTYKWDGQQWLITSHHSSAMPEKN